MTGLAGFVSKDRSHTSKFNSIREFINHRGNEYKICESYLMPKESTKLSLSLFLNHNQKLKILENNNGFFLLDIFYISESNWKKIIQFIQETPFDELNDKIEESLSIGGFISAKVVGDEVMFYRSRDGSIPFYYSHNTGEIAFSSEKKGLYAISHFNVMRLKPGEQLILKNDTEISVTPAPPMKLSEDVRTEEEQLEDLKRIVTRPFNQLRGLDKCGVLFSGGVDSSLAALLTKKNCENVLLFSASSKESHDTSVACDSAEYLDLPLVITEISPELIWESLPSVLYSIETSVRMHVEIALPFFISSKTANELGYSVLISGQGPDELFGGYARHIRLYQEKNQQNLNEQLRDEISVTHENNIERDEKAVAFNSESIFFPFLDPEFVRFSLNVPAKFKLNPNQQVSRKIIFRKLAEELGLSPMIAQRPKKATQYSSGTSKMIEIAFLTECPNYGKASAKEKKDLIQTILDSMLFELGFPGRKPASTGTAFNREPLDSLKDLIEQGKA